MSSDYSHDKHYDKHYDKCCDPCDKRMQGAQGPQGVQGPAGANGRDGRDGQNGLNGKDGVDGQQGPQGIEGPQGIPGTCVNCYPDHGHCDCPKPEYADLYSQQAQELIASPGPNQAGGVVLFASSTVATANIDISQAMTTGKVIINRAGWYDVSTGVCGTLNPVSSPLLAWTMSLFQNGNIVPGSTAANMTLSPEQKANEIFADVFIHCNVGDVLTLANTSTSTLLISSPTLGSFAVPNSAFFKIFLLEAD